MRLTRIFHTPNAGSGDPAYRSWVGHAVGRVPSRGAVSAFQSAREISGLTPVSRRELIRRLRKLGWEGPMPGGKHEFMGRGEAKLPIPNSHGSGEISVGKLAEILNEIGVSREEWQRRS